MKQLCIIMTLCLLGTAFADPQLKKSAEAGDAESQVKLGIAYRDGKGVPQNEETAVAWFRKAAEQGNPRGQDNYGFMLLRGRGIPQDEKEAVKWFERCAAQGNHWGLNNLANCYERGEGVKRDAKKSTELRKQAVAAGSDYACIALANEYLPGASESPDWGKARAWLEKGAAMNGERSASTLAYLLWHGVAGEQDRTRAKEIWADSDPMALRYYTDLLHRRPATGQFANIPVDHLHQGYNLCGPTAVAMATTSWGKPLHPYAIKRSCTSAFGEGTDWSEIVAALHSHDLPVEIATWPDTDAGFDAGMQAIYRELDAGHVVVVDIIAPENEARLSGHTMLATGYDAKEQLLIIHDPAQPHPGIRLIPYDEWKAIWHSRWYSKKSPGRSRPVIRIKH